MADTTNKYNFLDYEGLSLFWNNVKNIIDTDKIETNNAITNLDTRVDTVEGALANQIISITYTELKTLRDGGQLVPGQQYRITDYTCTTTTAGTRSAGHQFDVIVTADSESTLNEEARAIKHEGDSYFGGCDLNAWKIWYCLDNDTTRFDWADGTNGKGVIYRMIDEFGNDVPYDFKNIQFYRQWDSDKSLWSTISSDNTGVPCYNFSSEGNSSTTSFTDMSLSVSNKVYSNVIKGYAKNNKQILNNNCFFGNQCYSNYLGNNCYNNSFGRSCYYNTIGNNCYSNYFGNSCFSTSFGNKCYNNYLGGGCYGNSFGNTCYSNRLDNSCQYNTFGTSCDGNILNGNCSENSFGNNCYNNTFGNNCSSNSFGNNCAYNSFGRYGCSYNSFGNYCYHNIFGESCSSNSFRNSCWYNCFGNYCYGNSFGNDCDENSFRVSAHKTAALKDYVQYNHFDDGCSYNVIWNSGTTSSSVLLKNINVNRGVVGTSSSYNMININVLNSEQEINVNQVDGIVLIDNISDKLDKIIEISHADLVTLRDNSKLIPGQQYRIIDYITTTSQENTRSIGHQFDIIVTALNESTLSEEAQAIKNSNDGYFDGSNLSAWKIWYCLDNDTTRFAWAGDVKVDEITYTSYNSSGCTIKPELINGNAFITPFNFESCVWVDGNNDGFAYSDDHIHHDISELVYEWGYFTDENGVKQLCIYKSDADLYAQEGHPDYGDKYLYRGVVNVDGTEYDYWQKWDVNGEYGLNVQNSGDYVFATTQRIVSNPEAYSVTTVTEDIYGPGKGVIYRMIDEWNNDVPYDFKNIQFARDWPTIAPDSGLSGTIYCYTFSVFLNGFSESATADDESVKAKECMKSDGGGCFGNNVIKVSQNMGICSLNDIVFVTDWSAYSVNHYNNTFGCNCNSNTFGYDCYSNTFGDDCYNNTFSSCFSNSFGNNCSYNTFGYDCYNNTFGNDCHTNSFGSNCNSNLFGNSCSYNSFRDECFNNSLGNSCNYNKFGNRCENNSFGNECDNNSFRVNSSTTALLKDIIQNNHFDDGCSYNVIWNSDTTSSNIFLKNINVNRGVVGTSSSYNMININTLNQDYEIQVAKNSKGEIKIYCEADLIA